MSCKLWPGWSRNKVAVGEPVAGLILSIHLIFLMRSKWKNFVLSWKIQKKINAANQVLNSQRIKLKQLHLNSLDLLQKKQEFSFLKVANPFVPTLSVSVQNNSFLELNNQFFSTSSVLKKKEMILVDVADSLAVSSPLVDNASVPSFNSPKKLVDKTVTSKSSFFKSKKSYFFFKKINKIENKKLKRSFLQPLKTSSSSLNTRWTSFKDIIAENDSDFQNVIDVEKYTGILSNRPIVLKKNNFNIPLDTLDIVFSIASYTTSRFLLIRQFMFGHKFGEFLFNRKLGKKKTKKKN